MSRGSRALAWSLVGVSTFMAAGLAGGLVTTPAAGQVVGDRLVSQVSGVSLSPEEAGNLRYIREEEFLAHDVYVIMSRHYRLPIFATIADSEVRHTAAVARLLETYGIADPAASHTLGDFTDPTLQELFDELTVRGKRSLVAALRVGVFIERTDLSDLADAIDVSTSSHVDDVLQALRSGSRNHLRAYRSQLDQL